MISPEAIKRRRERDRLKKQRKRARIKAERARVLTAKPISKTSAAYRQIRFGRVPEMSKAQMRAEIARAFENTAQGNF